MAAGRQLKDIFNYIGCFPCSRNFYFNQHKRIKQNSQSTIISHNLTNQIIIKETSAFVENNLGYKLREQITEFYYRMQKRLIR